MQLQTKYDTVIGLEIHCELKTASKIFCGCPNDFYAKENENVCPVCLGMPGTLPVLNRQAVLFAARAGLALNCRISTDSVFDRKNYFYPDLPKAYQISQFEKPLCQEGYLDIKTEDGTAKRIRILRIHMEEDAGKLVHDSSSTLLDNNRCGVPLIEIVTYPDMSTPQEAEAFARKIRSILQFAGVSDCKMQQGSLRFDVNLSLKPAGSETLGTRTEMKNLNSFRSLLRSAQYEEVRQADILDRGGTIVQETRRWDDVRGVSVAMRSKEDAHDYRYFPDPDLIRIHLSEAEIADLADSLPELPEARAVRYAELGLGAYDAGLLVADETNCRYFDAALASSGNARLSCSLVTELSTLLADPSLGLDSLKISPQSFADLVSFVSSGRINMNTGKKLLKTMEETGQRPLELIEGQGLSQISDESEIESVVKEVIEANQASVADIAAGKMKAMGFLVGAVMKKTGGAANPAVVNATLKRLLGLSQD